MRRPPANTNGVSLFPFLAVLLCTMGSLILLLMLIADQARTQAAKERAAATVVKPPVDDGAARRRREDLEWEIEQLARSRDQTNADLAVCRDQLSHLEEHAQRLRQQLAQLEAAAKIVDSQSTTGAADAEKLQAELEELRRKVAEAEERLAKAKAEGRKPQAFAVVPFDGANGTRRRPIYIECRGDAVVLQPEGIILKEADFAGALGPSNPLASAVRVAGEYLRRANGDRDDEQPYPLLLVRPSGIGAYYAARAAMSSWDSEFGYELIEEDWPLEFPPADPLLAQMMATTIEEARARQVLIARAAPSLRKTATRRTFGVAPSGRGIVSIDGDDANNGGGNQAFRGRPPFGSPGQGMVAGNNSGGAANDAGGGNSPFGGGSASLGGENATANLGAAGPSFPGSGATSNHGAGGGPGDGQYGDDSTGGAASGNGSAGVGNFQPASRNGDGITSGSSSGGNSSTRGGSNGNAPGGPSAGGRYAGGGTGGTGATGGSGGTSGSNANGGSGNSTNGGGGEQAGGGAGGDPSAMAAAQQAHPSQYVESLAGKRGADWGLPESSRRATPLTRPVQIYCFNDGLTLLNDRGTPEKLIPLKGATTDAVDDLVSQVWTHVGTWGLAGRGMYWKPVLSMHVAPDGMARYDELRQLLVGSGLEVTGKPIGTATTGATNARR